MSNLAQYYVLSMKSWRIIFLFMLRPFTYNRFLTLASLHIPHIGAMVLFGSEIPKDGIADDYISGM